MNTPQKRLSGGLLVLALAACSSPAAPPAISSLTAMPSTLSASGGQTTLNWAASGTSNVTLSASPSTGVTGLPVGPITATSATVGLPANPTTSPVVYTFTLTAQGASPTPTATRTVQVTINPTPAPTTGSLTVNITGLPGGASGSVTVSGSNGFSQTLPQTATLTNLAPGDYSVSAAPITAQNVGYDGAVTGSPAAVSAGQTATIGVVYTPRPPRLEALALSRVMVQSGSASQMLWVARNAASYTLSIVPDIGVKVDLGNGLRDYTGPITFADGMVEEPNGVARRIIIQPPSNSTPNIVALTATLTVNGAVTSVSQSIFLSVAGSATNTMVANNVLGGLDRFPVYALTRGSLRAVRWEVDQFGLQSTGGQLNFSAFDADGRTLDAQQTTALLGFTSFTLQTLVSGGSTIIIPFQNFSFTPSASVAPGVYALVVTPQPNNPNVTGTVSRFILIVQ